MDELAELGEPGTTAERDEAARLRRFWDAAVRDHPARVADPNGNGPDPSLVETVRRVHALDAARGPSAALAARIWERTLADATRQAAASPRPLANAVSNGRAIGVVPAPLAAERRRRRSPVAELATAAIVLLSLGLGLLGGRWMDGGTGDGGLPGFGAPGTADPAADAPAPEECRVAPRSREEVLALLGDPAGRTVESDVSEPIPAYEPIASLPRGVPAEAGTISLIRATIRELNACENADDLFRGFALVTDGFLRSRPGGPGEVGAAADMLATPPSPRPVGERSLMPTVHDVRLLADGRVGAVVDGVATVAWPDSGTTLWFVFVRQGDRYLLDEVREVGASAMPSSAATVEASPSDAFTVPPRPLEEIRRLDDQASEPGVRPLDRLPGSLPVGVPADAEVVAAVERTLREDAACQRAGQMLRAAALRTDEFFLRFFATEGPLTETELAAFQAGANEQADREGWQLLPGSPVVALPDGRVGVLVEPGLPPDFEWAPEAGVCSSLPASATAI